MMKRCLILTLAAGTVCCGTAFGQSEQGPLPFGGEVRLDPVGYPSGPVTGRAIGDVYDNLTNTFGNGSSTHLGTSEMIMEDISFSPGPWATATGRILTEITYGMAVITTPTAGEDVLLIFWDEDDTNYAGVGGAGTNMINPNAVPLAVVRVNTTGNAAGFYWQFTVGLTGLPGGGVAIPDGDSGFSLQVAWVTDGFTPPDADTNGTPDWYNLSGGMFSGCASATDRSTVFASNSGAPQGGNPATVGSTNISYGRDISNTAMCPNIGQLIGNGSTTPATAGDIEHRTIAAAPQRGFMVRFRGDIVVAPPTVDLNLGCLNDGNTTNSSLSVNANQVRWAQLCLNGDANDNALQFLDIDTEGSAANLSVALFNDGGALVASDEADGSGENALLTFGVGRRAAVGDGTQYDGRDGELLAGTYYLAVGPNGTTFGSGFTATPGADAGGSVTLNLRTNTNGAALDPSVPPAIPDGQDLGVLTTPGAGTAAVETGLRGIQWYAFEICGDAADPSEYLDIDFSGSTATADTEAFIFDSNGNLVAVSDDSGTTLLSQFSFGQMNPARPAIGTGLPDFMGQNGNLPAGQYYMGVGLFNVVELFDAANNGRWHLRATSGSNLQIRADFYTEIDTSTDCGPSCASCAADYDQSGGVDGDDITAFFNDWLVGAPCSDVDSSGGTDGDDIGFFFERWLAGGCL